MNKTYKLRKQCRACNSKKLEIFYDLGKSPVADDYTKKPNRLSQLPLKMLSCIKCGFKQLSIVVDQDKVYGDYLYTTTTSKGLIEHFKKNFYFIKKKKYIKKGDFIIYIGSNEGSNLQIFKENKCEVLGVEPSKELSKISSDRGIKTLNGFFNKKIVKQILKNYKKKPGLICIYNLLANIDDLNKFMKDLLILTSKNTYIVIESFSLLGIVKDNLFDNIYHEHLSYFSIENLKFFFKKYDLNIIYAEHNDIKGGSIKIVLSKINKVNNSVERAINYEKKFKLNNKKTYLNLQNKNSKLRENIFKFLDAHKNKKIAGYGASCSSTVLIHYLKIKSYINFFFDDETRRNNLYSPSTNIRVFNPKQSLFKKIDFIIIIAWRYEKNIIQNIKKNFK
jgi:hypothetical protein